MPQETVEVHLRLMKRCLKSIVNWFEIDGTNIEWQLNLSSSLERMGDARLALDHAISAVAAYEESVVIRRRLIELDGSNLQCPDEVSFIIKKRSTKLSALMRSSG